jgi:hypothetical protein
MMLSHSFHPICRGQCAGGCSVGLRAGAAKRAGTLTRSLRRVAPRATACPAGEMSRRRAAGVRDHRAGQPRAVRGEQPRRDMREWPVDQVGEGGLHDRVFAVGKVGLGGGQGRKVKNGYSATPGTTSGGSGVLDPTHHQPGGEAAMPPHAQGVGCFGDDNWQQARFQRSCYATVQQSAADL